MRMPARAPRAAGAACWEEQRDQLAGQDLPAIVARPASHYYALLYQKEVDSACGAADGPLKP